MAKDTIGFIGLGIMGTPMANHLLDAGHQLVVYDIIPEAVQRLVNLGARAEVSCQAVASRVDIVISMVPDSPNVETVYLSEDGVLAGARVDTLLIDMSTISPATAIAAAERAKEIGCPMLDAPVSGGDVGAKNAALSIMVGGDEAVMEDCREILQTMGDIVHCGDIGTGEVAKIVNNYICLNSSLLIAEGIVLGVKCGMKPDRLLDVLASGSAESWMLHYWGSKALKGDFNPGFYLDLTIKDITLALATAKELKVPVPVGALCQQLLQAGSAAGKGKQDFTAMLTMLEELAGVEVRSESKG